MLLPLIFCVVCLPIRKLCVNELILDSIRWLCKDVVGKCEEISLGKFVVLLDFVIAIFGDLVLYSHLFNLLCLKWQLEMHFHSLLCYNLIFFFFFFVWYG